MGSPTNLNGIKTNIFARLKYFCHKTIPTMEKSLNLWKKNLKYNYFSLFKKLPLFNVWHSKIDR